MIVGKIYFLLVRIKIKHMEIAIIKRETTGSGPNTFTDNVTIAKYEIMDGAPVRGESIPIRVFLAGYDLTPTMRDVNKKFSVRYFLNLVLMDTEDRRYFKQQEITLWRRGMCFLFYYSWFAWKILAVNKYTLRVNCNYYLKRQSCNYSLEPIKLVDELISNRLNETFVNVTFFSYFHEVGIL